MIKENPQIIFDKQNKQLLQQMLSRTLPSNIEGASSKQNKSIETLIQSKLQRICILARELLFRNDRIGQFCVEELKKKHVSIKKQHPCLYLLPKIQIQPSQQPKFVNFTTQFGVPICYFLTFNNLYMFDNAFIPFYSYPKQKSFIQHQGLDPIQQLNITFILSQSPTIHILSYIQICINYSKIIRCIMPVGLWKKVRELFEIFWGHSIYQIISDGSLVLYNEERLASFDFEGSMLFFSKNLWFWHSYQIYFIIKGSKYVIKNPGIKDQETIYVGWRKNAINQTEYCRLIDKTMHSNIAWSYEQNKESDKISQQGKCSDFTVLQKCMHYLTPVLKNFQSFCQCQVFTTLPQQLINEIYLNGQISQSTQGQILHKGGTKLDKFFVIIQGQLQRSKDVKGFDNNPFCQNILLGTSECYDLQQIFDSSTTQKQTLLTYSSRALIYTITIQKLRYILSHYLCQLEEIYNCQAQNLEKQLKALNLSKWMLKVVRTDSLKCRDLSHKTTKTLNNSNLKISNNIWKKLCKKNIKTLSQIKQSKS